MKKSNALKPFLTSAPEHPKWDRGYGGGTLRPSDLATEVFGEGIPGEWLCCYMLRRFGWPNQGSDDYKNLMSWNLTTGMEGLFLSVTPYLGSSEDNLHFGVRFTKAIGNKIERDPERESFLIRRHNAIMKWWKMKGIKLYAWGYGLKEGDADELVHKYCDDTKHPEKVYGLWKRTPNMNRRKGEIPKQAEIVDWWLAELIKSKHPEVKLPEIKRSKKGRVVTPFQARVNHALKRTILDLLRDTYVRDINFNCFGKTEHEGDSCAKKPKPVIEPGAGYWPGAGNTPEYWYSDEAKKERAKAKKNK